MTIRLVNSTYRTRLVVIDAPEMGQWPGGRRVKKHLLGVIRDSGWMVFIETDIGQSLRLSLKKKNKLNNERMIRDGYAVLLTMSPNAMDAGRVEPAERRVRNDRKGIGVPKELRGNPVKYREKHPRKEYGF